MGAGAKARSVESKITISETRNQVIGLIYRKEKTFSMFLLPNAHPLGLKTFPRGHSVHRCPVTPGLQMHWPVICLQSGLNEPNNEQPHAVKYNESVYIK